MIQVTIYKTLGVNFWYRIPGHQSDFDACKIFKNITNYIIKSTYYERNEQYSKTFFVHEIINY